MDESTNELKKLEQELHKRIHAGEIYAALSIAEKTLEIAEEALGPDHPDVAQSLNNLAGLYHEQGNYALAEPLCERVLAIHEKALGHDHSSVATSLNNLARLYRVTDRKSEAEKLEKRAAAIEAKPR